MYPYGNSVLMCSEIHLQQTSRLIPCVIAYFESTPLFHPQLLFEVTCKGGKDGDWDGGPTEIHPMQVFLYIEYISIIRMHIYAVTVRRIFDNIRSSLSFI